MTTKDIREDYLNIEDHKRKLKIAIYSVLATSQLFTNEQATLLEEMSKDLEAEVTVFGNK